MSAAEIIAATHILFSIPEISFSLEWRGEVSLPKILFHQSFDFRRTIFTDIELDTEQLIHEVEEALTRYPQTSSAEKTQWELFHFIPPFRQNP